MASSLFSPRNPMPSRTPATSNPKIDANTLKAAMEIIRKYGNGDAKTAFFNFAREKGVDPRQFMEDQLK